MGKTIVERAMQLTTEYDEVWAVFDRETKKKIRTTSKH